MAKISRAYLCSLLLQNIDSLRLTATDKDAGDNGRITYRITSGNEFGLLRIEEQTGVIRLARLPHESIGAVDKASRLVVRASDNGTPARSVIATVQLKVSRPVS